MSRISKWDTKQRILYEDRDILVYHKAAGIPVQSAEIGVKDLESMLLNYLAEKEQRKESSEGKGAGPHKIPYLGIIHRLDQPVEGILVFAKNKKAAAGLSRQISDGTMKKVYIAVCCVDKSSASENNCEKKEAHLTSWLKKDARTNTSSIVSPDTPGAKKAELNYCILQRQTVGEKEYAFVRIDLLTGRHHQIRVQMAGAGLPLYGDRKYNSRWEEYLIPEYDREAENFLKLCAARLTFRHPGTGEKMCFTVRPDQPFFR